MAELLKQVGEFVFKIKEALDTAGNNKEVCRRIGDLLNTLSAIAKHLQGSPEIMEDDLMRDTVERLQEALQRALKLVAKCARKGSLSSAFNADDNAQKLHGVCLDLLLNMIAVQLANSALNNSMLAKLKENQAHTNSMLAKIVAAQPDLHLPKEEEKSISSQIKNKEETKKTDVPSSQNKNKREAKKTDVTRPEVEIQKKNKRGLAESASAASVVGQYDDGSSAINNEASSSISKSVDEAQSVGVSAAPIHPQKIISISEKLGETGRYKVDPHSSNTSKVEVSPQQLIFPLEQKNEETTGCPVNLTNKTGDYVVILIKPINERFTKPEIMKPHSTLVVHTQPPKDTDKFEVLMIIIQSKRDHRKLESSIVGKLNMDSGFMVCVEKLKAEVYRAVLTAITCDPASCQIISRSIENVTSIDAHPTKTWIVTGHEGGIFSIWDYQKQETVMELQVNKEPGKVYSAKFTAEGKWLAVGDSHGYIYVYDCTDTKLQEVKKFRAHNSKSVLASHPTYLLSWSDSSIYIKVLDLSKNCEEIKKFKVKSWSADLDGVRSVKSNPRDTDTIACVTCDERVKVGNINTSILETTLKGPCVEADFFFTHQHLVTLSSKNYNSEIWDLKTGKVVHTLSVSGCKTTRVACHPKLPILVTTLDDGTVCLWDASTYRLEKMVHITNSECLHLVFLPDTNGLPRLVVAFKTMIAIMEVNLPIATP